MDIDWALELQEYLRIDTSHPRPDYKKAIDFLINLTKRIKSNLIYNVYIHSGYPMLLVTKPGRINMSILLNSHMDVVNVTNVEDWTFPPFDAHHDTDTDRIYGRGTQDMKSHGIHNLALLHRLRDVQLDHTIHVSFVPNEEIGGIGGLSEFIRTSEFKSLDVQFVIDEGCASPFKEFFIFFAERTIWQFAIKIHANPGHASMNLNDTCEKKMRVLLNEIEQFRKNDFEKNYKGRQDPKIGYTTTINLTKMVGGDLLNVLPRQLTLYFDMRIGLDTPLNVMADEITRWMWMANKQKESTDEEGVEIEWLKRSTKSKATNVQHYMCQRFINFFKKNNIPHILTIAPGTTDGRFVREYNLPVFGFTAINQTPPLLHGTDEYIFKQQFLDHIDLVAKLIQDISQR